MGDTRSRSLDYGSSTGISLDPLRHLTAAGVGFRV